SVGVPDRLRGELTVRFDVEHVDQVEALRGDEQVLAVRREPDLRRRREEEWRVGIGETERARRSFDRLDAGFLDPEAADEPGESRVEDVREISVQCDAPWERSAGGD